jgi:N-acetylmuramoyl-L-alanine amidase
MLPEAQRTAPIRTERYGSTPEVPQAYLDPPQGTPSIGQRPIAPPWRTDPLRAQRLALIGAIALAIALAPALAATVIAAGPTVVVEPGDTLTAIARRHGLSISRLVELNDLTDPNRIFAGQRLRVAAGGGARTSGGARTANRMVHVVSAGSTLWGIAAHYGVSVGAIAAANHLANPGLIFAGQRLVIPGASAPRPSRAHADAGGHASAERPAASGVHVVSRGSTLWGIAASYGVSVGAIAAANHLANPSLIFAGQRLVIPGGITPVSQALRARMPSAMAAVAADRAWVRRIIVGEADRFGVPRAFALAVAWQESGWQQGVVSHAGAVGVMQLMPGTAVWIGDTMLSRPVAIHDAHSNITAGVRLLSHYLDRYGGNRDLVLAAYYQGQRAVDRYGIYPVSRPYIASIRRLEQLFGG